MTEPQVFKFCWHQLPRLEIEWTQPVPDDVLDRALVRGKHMHQDHWAIEVSAESRGEAAIIGSDWAHTRRRTGRSPRRCSSSAQSCTDASGWAAVTASTARWSPLS